MMSERAAISFAIEEHGPVPLPELLFATAIAARRREAPLFFARLRAVQMLVPLASLAAELAARLLKP